MPGKRPAPRGFILPLSLLILASVTAITASLVRGLFSGISVARGTSAAVIAYFAAETGVEKALFEVKTRRLTGTSTFAQTLFVLNDVSFDGTLAGSGALFNIDASKTETLNLGLKQNQVTTIDLFDPDDLLSNSASGVGCLRLDGDDANPSPVNNVTPWLEITLIELDPQGFDPTSAVDTHLEADRGDFANTKFALGTSGWPRNMSVTSTNNYRVRIKALYDDVKQLTVTPLNSCAVGGVPVDLESRVVIKSVGSASAGARQAMTASANWLTPSSPLFDYALFSEEAIEKR